MPVQIIIQANRPKTTQRLTKADTRATLVAAFILRDPSISLRYLLALVIDSTTIDCDGGFPRLCSFGFDRGGTFTATNSPLLQWQDTRLLLITIVIYQPHGDIIYQEFEGILLADFAVARFEDLDIDLVLIRIERSVCDLRTVSLIQPHSPSALLHGIIPIRESAHWASLRVGGLRSPSSVKKRQGS
jgi:hypothetical protein